MPTKKTSYFTIAVLLTAALLWHGTAMADAASAAINNDSYLKTVNFNDYISSKNYAPVSINNSYGQLVTESQIGIYKSAALQDFYKDLVCKGMWAVFKNIPELIWIKNPVWLGKIIAKLMPTR
jgi:hypothetical protein